MIADVLQTKQVVRRVTADGKLLNQYLKIGTIGEGPYSKIKKMKNIKDNKFYAMKKYNLFVLKKKNKLLKRENGNVFYTNAAQQVMNEVRILKQAHHENIARLFEIIEDKEQQKIYLFLQFCEKGQIANWSSKKEKFTLNPAITSSNILKQQFISIARGIKYLHDSNIVHRDIKPQNILLDADLNIKIIDFGRAVKLVNSEQRLKGSEGTYHFMAPQMLSQVFPEGYDGKHCDMWSLGVTFYAILFQTLPFYEQLLIKLFQKIQKGQYVFPSKHKPEYTIFIPIIQKLLIVNSKERLTVNELIEQLEKLL